MKRGCLMPLAAMPFRKKAKIARSMPVMTADNLTKTYRVADKQPGVINTLRHFVSRQTRDIHAVRDVSFSIEPGEVVGFLGPNGAGKTTTLKMLTGLIHPTRGEVDVLGFRPFDRKAALLHEITLVMGQKQQLIWDLPAADSLRINAAVYRLSRAEADRRVDELKAMLGLSDELHRPVRKLSLGERMKCELLAALLHHPKVLFLDEPTLGLDVNAQIAVRDFLKAYNQQHGAAIVLTSHYMADITALCDRVIVIHHGRLLYDGSLDAVTQKFAPWREIRLELAEQPDEVEMQRFGEVQSIDGCKVTLVVERDVLTGKVDQLLSELSVNDLTVSDPPIEDVIGRLFASGDARPQADEPVAQGVQS